METIRRGERKKKQKRPFSPSHESPILSVKKTRESTGLNSHSIRKAPRNYDLDPSGKKFECELCKSNFIVDPTRKKCSKGRAKQKKYSPRYKQDPVTGKELMLCNACGLKLGRPGKHRQAPVKIITEEEKHAYLREVKQFTDMLKQQFNDKDAERLYCPNISYKHCGCVQNYIIGGGEDTVFSRAEQLLQLCKEAKYLSSLKHEMTQDSENCKIPNAIKVVTKVGLGNGQKKSQSYLQFVLDNRSTLRNDFNLCEKACQKIIGYSNNLLYRKLKTENNKQRLEPKRQLKSMLEISKMFCCSSNCVGLVGICEKLVEEWRARYQVSQAERRRVIAEMLTPVADNSRNCYKFIQLLTGCSPSIIAKVSKHLEMTDWDREPPEHGLKKYWEKQQQQQNECIYNIEDRATNCHVESYSACNTESGSSSHQTSGKSVVNVAMDVISVNNNSYVDDPNEYPPNRTVTSSRALAENPYNKPDTFEKTNPGNSIVKILPTLEKKREEILRMQKELADKQSILKIQQDAIERDMLKALQCQKQQNTKERKLSGEKKSSKVQTSKSPNEVHEMNSVCTTEKNQYFETTKISPKNRNGTKSNAKNVENENIHALISSHIHPLMNKNNDALPWPSDSYQIIGQFEQSNTPSHSSVIQTTENGLVETNDIQTYTMLSSIPNDSIPNSGVCQIDSNLPIVQVLTVYDKHVSEQSMGTGILGHDNGLVQSRNHERTLLNVGVNDSGINEGVLLMDGHTSSLVTIPESMDIAMHYSGINEVQPQTHILNGSVVHQINPVSHVDNAEVAHVMHTNSLHCMTESPIERSKDVLLSSVASSDEKLVNLSLENQISNDQVQNLQNYYLLPLTKGINPNFEKSILLQGQSSKIVVNSKIKGQKFKRPRRHSVAVMNNVAKRKKGADQQKQNS